MNLPSPAPPNPGGGFTRYHCPVGCGWHHDERHTNEPAGPVCLPDDFASVSVGDAISAMVAQQALDTIRRVEGVLREHLALHHPDFVIPEE